MEIFFSKSHDVSQHLRISSVFTEVKVHTGTENSPIVVLLCVKNTKQIFYLSVWESLSIKYWTKLVKLHISFHVKSHEICLMALQLVRLVSVVNKHFS